MVKLAELSKIPDKGDVFNIEGKIKVVWERKHIKTEFSEYKQSIVISDDSGEVVATLWDCEEIKKEQEGSPIYISKARKGTYEGKPQLNVPDQAEIKITETAEKPERTMKLPPSEITQKVMLLEKAIAIALGELNQGWIETSTSLYERIVHWYNLLLDLTKDIYHNTKKEEKIEETKEKLEPKERLPC